MSTTRITYLRDAVALLQTGVIYWLTIVPRMRWELRRWERRARAIPDPELRALAVEKLTAERLNPEAAAFFAVLAPRRARTACARLMVAFQVAYDYLDAVNEQPEYQPLARGLQLHQALTDCVTTGAAGDYYGGRCDGGYLAEFVTVCRETLRDLDGVDLVRERLLDAVEQCGMAQSLNHAGAGLPAWCVAQDAPGYEWWEVAAGGISCLAVHALFAAAGERASAEESDAVDGGYFPSVCAISALLDSLIDYGGDMQTGNHSFVGHYRSSGDAALRFAAILSEADGRLRRLRRGHRHAVLLVGIVAFYLSSPEARTAFAEPVRASSLAAVGGLAWPMVAVLGVRRRHVYPAKSRVWSFSTV